jgi:4-hydroxybenzoate polyprenyltransferase
VVLIAAAGYIINDIEDLKADLVNKPDKVVISKIITTEKAKRYYLILNTFGIVCGLGLCLNIQKPSYSFFFIGTSLLLYYYSKKLKSKALIGNISISLLTAVSILLLALFDIDQALQNYDHQFVLVVLVLLSCFAFILNLIREIVKDIEDVNGDYMLNMRTLPIIFGRNRIKKLGAILCVIPISLLLFIIINYSLQFKHTAFYLFLSSLIPMIYVALKLISAASIKDFRKLSAILKIIMFLGLNALIILSINS